jgi:hypothetical protein
MKVQDFHDPLIGHLIDTNLGVGLRLTRHGVNLLWHWLEVKHRAVWQRKSQSIIDRAKR